MLSDRNMGPAFSEMTSEDMLVCSDFYGKYFKYLNVKKKKEGIRIVSCFFFSFCSMCMYLLKQISPQYCKLMLVNKTSSQQIDVLMSVTIVMSDIVLPKPPIPTLLVETLSNTTSETQPRDMIM